MITLNHKAKQYLLIALKVFILAFTFGYIYLKITRNESLDLNDFALHVYDHDTGIGFSILLFILLASINWLFEILKWRTLVSEIQFLSLLTAMKQSLASLTVSLATPNRIGEYGAKAYFFEKDKRKNILLLTFFSNSIQMGVTSFFGIIGLILVIKKYNLSFSGIKLILVLFVIILLIIFAIVFKKQQLLIKGLSISKVISKFKNLSNQVKVKTIVFAIVRYLVFCFLFFSLLLFFGANNTLLQSIPLIFAMYLTVSVVPTVFIFDVVVRGGAALWLFSMAGISEITILCTVLSIWILNFVIPSIIGGYYLFTYKPEMT